MMIDLSLHSLTTAIRDSEFLRTLDSLRSDWGVGWALAGESVRPLREAEIRRLVADGNTAEDWSRVRVAEWFRPGRVRQSDFRGDVTLGRFEETVRGPGGVELPSGIHRCSLSNCVIGHEALVRNVGLLHQCTVGERALVSDCAQVIGEGATTFGNEAVIPIGPQCGGRWLKPFAEITLDLAIALTSPQADAGLEGRYAALLVEYLKRTRSTHSAIGAAASVTNVPVLRNAYVGPSARIHEATRIEHCTILSSQKQPVHVSDGACLSHSLVQWGTHVRGPAVVERSVLLEHASIEPFAKVQDSVIGPNSAIGGAEVTASLVGPFVGCHHQGLLIAARWPGGRGNLGYGSAVGCNHTSRLPDQEAVLGEGLFVGLGAKLQYPADFSRAPYSIVASGAILPPQKLAFPFSLVRSSTEHLPGAPAGANVVIPGWVLTENLYSVQRAAHKFRARDRATRHHLAHDVFRPEVMDVVAEALRRLMHPAAHRDFYTECEIPGLGRNVLLEQHRLAAVRVYSEHLERIRLLRLLNRTADALAEDPEWRLDESEERDLRIEFGRLSELMEDFGAAVERSKLRDEQRGPAIIDDYDRAHGRTQDDPVVRQTWIEVRTAQERAARILADFLLPGTSSPKHLVSQCLV